MTPIDDSIRAPNYNHGPLINTHILICLRTDSEFLNTDLTNAQPGFKHENFSSEDLKHLFPSIPQHTESF